MNPKIIDAMSWRMAEVYGAVVDRILVNLARHFKLIAEGKPVPGSWEYQVKKLAEMGQVTRETEEIILKSLGGTDEALQQMLEDAIRTGLEDAEPGLAKSAKQRLAMGQGFLPPEVRPRQMQAFQAYYRQSADKLNLVNTVMLDSTQKAYQATVADIVNRIERTQGILNTATGEVVSGVTAFNKAVRDGVKRMSDNGLTGFVDHGGHQWSPEAYVAMDIRSTMANTARAAVWERSDEYGVDLYQVSSHDGARPLCYPWQGKVISRADWTGEVEDLDGNKIHVYAQSETSYGKAAGLFGVNCGHFPIPFVPGMSIVRPPEQNAEENAKEYQESQQQRALERKLRNEKRDLEVLKAQEAPEADIKAQRAKVKAARDNLNGFCEETGRSRRSGREYRPIQANWNGAAPGPFDYGPTGKGTTRSRIIKDDDGNVLLSHGSTKAIQEAQSFDEIAEHFWYDDKFGHTRPVLNDNIAEADMNVIREIAEGVEWSRKAYGLTDEMPSTIRFGDLDGRKVGEYNRVTREITLQRGIDINQAYLTVVHEMTHFADDLNGGISDKLLRNALKNLGVEQRSNAAVSLQAWITRSFEAGTYNDPMEVLAYSVEDSMMNKTNRLSEELLRLWWKLWTD